MSWFSKHKYALIVFGILLTLNVYVFLQTLYTNDFDSSIQRVKEKLTTNAYKYEIHLQSTEKSLTASTLELHYADGSTETRPVLQRKQEWLTIETPRRLEYLTLKAPKPENNLQNNGHKVNIWSGEIGLMKVTTNPDFNFVVDENNRLWVVCSGRVTEKERPSVLLTILNPDGTFLIENQKISPEGIYSVYPVIQQMADGNMHIIWSSYIDEKDFLYYTTFDEQDGKLTMLSQTTYAEEGLPLLRPFFVGNDPGNPLVGVLTRYQFYNGFVLYRISPDGLTKQTTQLYADNGIVYHDISFFTGAPIKDVVLVKDSQGRYALIWDEIDPSGTGSFYISIFDEQLKTVSYRNDIGKFLAIHTDPRPEVILKDQKLYLFYSEEFTRLDPQNQICYNIIGEDGESIAEDIVLDGPSPLMLRDLTVALDAHGNFNFAWTDARISKASRLNRDLVVKSLNPQFESLVPPTALGDNLIDQMMPRLRFFNGQRYLVWADLKDGSYQLNVKSTSPGFLSSLQAKQQWTNMWEETIHAISVALLSIGAQILFLFPLNLFPLAGTLVVMYLFATHRIRDHWLNWISIFLSLLLLKYINLNILSKTSVLTLTGTYKLAAITGSVTLALFFLIHQGWKKWSVNALHKSLFLFGWLVVDTMILTLIYYFQRI